MKQYLPEEIEPKWQKYWENEKVNKTDLNSKKPYYCLDMFPYPSGKGLHVGHWSGYVYSDVWSRYMKLKGYDILHPMGWDAFGLPAENAAIKNNSHPKEYTKKAVANFTRQLKEMGAMYDWDLEINSSTPEYYKWTQWLFLQLYKNDLAYQAKAMANFCSSCQTVLANEQVVDGKCERCSTAIEQKDIKQWFFKITAFADQLLSDLDDLDWQDRVKKMQRNWIGKSTGADITFKLKGLEKELTVYTTRPDTLYGATFMVLAPENEIISEITTDEKKKEVNNYLSEAKKQTIRQRKIKTDKTGVFTGTYAINPVNGQEIPIWVSDYVLAEYGTGAIMAVPAHDQRDFEFAQKYKIPIIEVISPDGKKHDLKEAYLGEGELINSEDCSGVSSNKACQRIIKNLAKKGLAQPKTNYKLNDWLISRQRYWGAPIPIVHCPKCGTVPVSEKDLPVELPELDDFKPAKDGQSPLAKVKSFVETDCPKCGQKSKRETDTMDTFVDSAWYYLRYPNPDLTNKPFSKGIVNKWLPVDKYVGGIEHAVLHLLYARFITKALYKLKYLNFKEPFKSLFNQGMIYRKGKKMSKSAGNAIPPDDLVKKYGRDTVRGYELFIGPPEQDKEWTDKGIEGVYRYLIKAFLLVNKLKPAKKETQKEKIVINRYLKEINEDIESFSLNTVVSSLMKLNSELEKLESVSKSTIEKYIIMMSPAFPHIAEELWQEIGNQPSIFTANWPKTVKTSLKGEKSKVIIQINGKVRAILEKEVSELKNEAKIVKEAKSDPNFVKALAGKKIKDEIKVGKPIKLINFVV